MSIGWPDLGGALLWVTVGLVVIAGVIALLAWDARRRRSPHPILEVTGAVARMWLAVTAIGVIVTVWKWLSGGDTWIPALPVSIAWPETLPCEQGIPAEATKTSLVCAHVATADATIAMLSVSTRVVLALGELLGLVLAATPAVVVVVVCAQALRGAPFGRTVSRWLIIAAVVVLVAGLGAELVTSAGRALAAAEVLPPVASDAAVTTTGIFRLTVPLWPIGAACALGALGVVFRRGAVLQRETEGLV
ncbi:MAG TPA: hypothetical protein VNT50_07940 [Microbacterium sp.]|uniref:hypothetical protein n=1 Tax=Microbacterium sp. TaxID=51671 RepID=UPI002C82AE03|nr:hypothetical protein [Microbacterium sp.]HWI31408.1 hypothetical protein [Microbacterium sp.]